VKVVVKVVYDGRVYTERQTFDDNAVADLIALRKVLDSDMAADMAAAYKIGVDALRRLLNDIAA
jgi:hypothetical protein